ncbi:hypothetical protein NN6n1_35780 [Shinella zoogloeoides]
MNPTTDLSDEAMAVRWGGILNEVPELWDAIRLHEIKSRPAVTSVGFNLKSDWVSVSVDGGSGNVSRIQIRNPGRMK